MSALFDSQDGDTVTAPTRPDGKTVRLLESFNYRAEAVRRWTAEKATTVLKACQQEERIALRRAEARAKTQEGPDAPRGQPSLVERLAAADAIAQAAGLGLDELLQTVTATVYCLTDDELKRLAGYLAKLFRGQA